AQVALRAASAGAAVVRGMYGASLARYEKGGGDFATAADIAAGDIRVALMLETFHLSAKSWTADQFTVSLELEGCAVTSSTQFLRTLVTDCATGETVETVDTTLDGAPYTVTGTVAQCTPTAPADQCRDCEVVALCDVADGEEPHSFLRTVCRDCTGAVISVLDTELDGVTAYTPIGDVVRCGAAPAPAANPQLTSTAQRQTGAGAVTIGAGARSVTLVVYAGAPTISIGGAAAVPLAAGTSLSWGVDQGGPDGEELADAFTFAGVAGSDFLVTSTREA
ncbi:hypothetical protein ACPXCX_43640, partial [Streptomyces sp. DT225]